MGRGMPSYLRFLMKLEIQLHGTHASIVETLLALPSGIGSVYVIIYIISHENLVFVVA